MNVGIRLLGGFEVSVDGQVLTSAEWRRRDPAALVKVLALTEGHRLLRDQVLDTLWPDQPTELAAPRLHKAAHYARAILNRRDAVVIAGNTVSLFPHAEVDVDLARFEWISADAIAREDPQRARQAVEMYRGPLLPEDLYEPWAEQPRERARLRYLELLRLRGSWDLVVQTEPTDEDAHLNLAREMLSRGDPRSAVSQLDLLAKVLRDELDAVPSQEAVALRRRALGTPAVSLSWEQRAARRAPVPQPLTQTIGRDRDVHGVLELLEPGRVITLLGPGGVGKTRLGAVAAARYQATTNEAACFVDLTQVLDARAVARHVGHAIGVDLEGSAPPEPALVEALQGRSLLIVLDNFEHLLDAGEFLARLTQSSRGVTWLVTSRARLRIAAEHIFEVTPLSVGQEPGHRERSPGDAVVLFDQVARAVDPAFDLAEHRADVDEICRTVDGLPLAIELAARHVRTLSPALLRARLGLRLASSAGATRDLPARQQTVPATIDWSLELVGRAELELFLRMGVFSTPVPLDAVERVCGEEGEDVVDALTALCDHSLVRRGTGRDEHTTYGLLHLLRQRSRELAEAHDLHQVRRRHAHWAASVLDDDDHGGGPRVRDEKWTDAVTNLMPEIREAHAWAQAHDRALAAQIAAGLGPYWRREGHHDEGRDWVSSALRDADGLPEQLVARLLVAAGIVEWPRDQAVARTHWTRAISLFKGLGREHDLAYATALAATSHVGIADNYVHALHQCEEALGQARRVGDRALIARILNMKGELARVAGDDALALSAYQEGYELAVSAGDDISVPLFLGNLSFLADHRGEHAEALRLSADALQRAWTAGRRIVSAGILSQAAGGIHLALGRPDLSARLLGASDQALSTSHVHRHPCDVPEYDRITTGLRRALGESAWAGLHEEGRSISLDDAVRLTLEAVRSSDQREEQDQGQ